ncbi:protein tyrosine/serine phosphatase [Litorimonas taeanensis]|uniref:Protein tyrosine/serine phosphatase n=2 Tax=Litorimonas taeanensis TaxID=568099 RepID=A0A420WDS9_9PROT|nr:protein tyrosine/serine phosphatase [Litorimonas taeanensis]
MSLNLNHIADRRRANREALWGDHGFLRLWLHNQHDLGGGMYRAVQPSANRIEALAEMGIKTIINLRGESPMGFYLLEREACEKHGIHLVNYRMYSRDIHSVVRLKGVRDLFQRIKYPALMHCKSGADRAGIMSVLYRHFVMGDSIEQALSQLSFKYGHIKYGKTGVLDFFFESYLGHNRADPIDFMEWAETYYDPVLLKANFRSGAIGNILTDKILRRE